MKAFYLTDAGRIRDHNEDSVTILKNLNNEYLMIVADGMGGHRAGEVASSLAVAHLGKRFTETASVGSKLDAVNWLKDNINEINKFNNNNNILKIKNKTKIDYDIESISKETTLKGLFAREIIEKIKNSPDREEYYNDIFEIGLEILEK